MPIQVGEPVVLYGVVQNLMYESGTFRIVRVQSKNEPDKFPVSHHESVVDYTAKGNFLAPDYKGQVVELYGEWKYDTKYRDYSFDVQYASPGLPKTRSTAMAFLKSIKGIGEKLAGRICDECNGDIQRLPLDEDILAAKIKGFTVSKAALVCETVRKLNTTAELARVLKNSVPGETIQKIIRKYGTSAMDKVTLVPYNMALDKTVSFKEADMVALTLGWQTANKQRITTAIICAIRGLRSQTAAIVVETDAVLNTAYRLLHIDGALIQKEYEHLLVKRQLVKAGKYTYLYDDYVTERELSEKIVKCCGEKPDERDKQYYLRRFESWKQRHITLAENQELAVKAVGDNFLSVITGGPGTGKTATLKAIMETYQDCFPNSAITLMAPTGLAAKRMSVACGMEARTIHKTLGLVPADNDSGFDDSSGLTLNGGLVIVDEFSMVGIHIARFLFEAIVFEPDLRIVIVGDVDQLPPVSPGAVLDDLILCQKVKVTRLNRNFRQEAGSAIIDNAYAINEGNTNLSFTGNFQYREVQDKDLALETKAILDEVKRAFEESCKTYGLAQTFVLAPQRKSEVKNGETTIKTLLSTSSMNPILRDIVNPPAAGKAFFKTGSRIFRVGDRVINLKNTSEVMNGEIGYIQSIDKQDVPVITVNFLGNEVEYTPDMLKHLDLAYCITVHKAQGAEYESVIYPSSMTQDIMLQRNLLYTAVTRAKKNVLIIGNRYSIDKCIRTVKNKTKRDLLAARIVRGTQALTD